MTDHVHPLATRQQLPPDAAALRDRCGRRRSNCGGEARRLISQGGGYLNGRRLDSAEKDIKINDFKEMEIVLRAGKKHFFKIRIKSENNR